MFPRCSRVSIVSSDPERPDPKYDLYGKPTYWNASGTQISPTANTPRDLFTGERYIPEIGLYDLRNRFMSPDIGRFLQPDPIGFKGDPSNLYRYCRNDWGSKADPSGLIDISIPREWDVKLWVAAQNSRAYAIAQHEGKPYSQILQGTKDANGTYSNVELQNKMNKGGMVWVQRPQGFQGSGQTHSLVDAEPGAADKGKVALGNGHVHMDKTGKDTPDFSRGPKGDYAEAQKGRIIAKTNESDLQTDPKKVTRLTPQTDPTLAPQERVITPPTKEELTKWGGQFVNASSHSPQASDNDVGTTQDDGMGLAFIGQGPRPGPPQ
jgi:RHS repeat-associated protein